MYINKILQVFLIVALSAALSFTLFAASAVTVSAKTYEAKVKRVVDGDTIYVSYKGRLKKVRLLGIDAPESVSSKGDLNTKLGKKAASYTRKELLKKRVRLVFDKVKSDVYGRWLCHVYLGKSNFNLKLISKGYARAYFISPNAKYKKTFMKKEAEARKKMRGIWAGISYKTNPRKFPFVASNTAKKFHLLTCYHAKQIARERRMYFKSEVYAKGSGYAPCAICFRTR